MEKPLGRKKGEGIKNLSKKPKKKSSHDENVLAIQN